VLVTMGSDWLIRVSRLDVESSEAGYMYQVRVKASSCQANVRDSEPRKQIASWDRWTLADSGVADRQGIVRFDVEAGERLTPLRATGLHCSIERRSR